MTSAPSAVQSGQTPLDTSATSLRSQASQASANAALVSPVDVAAQDIDRLANVGAGVGTQLDITV